MLEVRATTRFKKEVKKAARQQKEMQRLGAAIDLLQAEELLPERNLDHALTGKDRKSTRLNSSHAQLSRMPSSA
jgi:mRNA interferase YafQ